ncbi:MAG: hypothetical protein WD939_05290 [Dehalococcoidia bacterium]
MSPLRPYLALLIVGLSAASLLVACDGDEGGSDAEVATATSESATATTQAEEGTATMARPVSEAGEAPVFYRTQDGFATLRANEPYKVLFRITNGYAEDTLSVSLEREGQEGIELETSRVEPQGEDLPGSYYPTNVELPEAGRWVIVVTAGEDIVEIPVEAGPAES